MKKLFLFLITVFSFLTICTKSTFAQVTIAQNGKALSPITISADADNQVRAQAQELADYLQKISGATFDVRTGNANSGIIFGTVNDLPAIVKDLQFVPQTQQDYLLRSNKSTFYIIGASNIATDYAIWDFLYRLGYRQFFPGENWEVIPQTVNLKVEIDAVESPDFSFRRIWSGSGSWPETNNIEKWDRWNRINRMEGTEPLNTSHSWNRIVKQYQEEFNQHPEYFALVDGKRQSKAGHKKFCISNAGLRKLVVRYALDYFEEHPNEESVSIDPSDFGGWCTCDLCEAIGTPSDRMVVLANDVVKAVRSKYPNKYVAFYAYNFHSAPPSLHLEPGVIVSGTTSFIKQREPFDKMVAAWHDKGAIIGTRDYMSVIGWDRDLPNESKAAQIYGMPEMLRYYHQLGTRFYIAEASDSWAPNGLGYYIASRVLWNVNEADHVEELFSDFIDKAFPDAQKPMRAFYQLINGTDSVTGMSFNKSSLGHLYNHLNEAWRMTTDSKVRARIGDLVLYLRYLEYFRSFQDATQEADQQNAYEKIMRLAYRTRNAQMIHGSVYYRKGFRGDLPVPKGVAISTSEQDDPWKDSQTYTSNDIERILVEGITNNPIKIENWKVELTAPLENASQKTILRTRDKQSVMLHALQTGNITISIKEIPDSSQHLPTVYSIFDLQGKLIQKGDLQADSPIKLAANQGDSFIFNTFSGVNEFSFSNAAAAYRSDIYRPVNPAKTESLYYFRHNGTIYVHVNQDVKKWKLKLITQTPGETAKVTIWNPSGEKKVVVETSETSMEEVTLNGDSGFWRIDFDKAQTGGLYKIFLSLDERLSPWGSVDPQYPLIVTNASQ